MNKNEPQIKSLKILKTMIHYILSKMGYIKNYSEVYNENKIRVLDKIDITNHKSISNGKYKAILFFRENEARKHVIIENENMEVLLDNIRKYIEDNLLHSNSETFPENRENILLGQIQDK